MLNAKGFVHKYGDNVDTDVIIPARYLNIADKKELATHCWTRRGGLTHPWGPSC